MKFALAAFLLTAISAFGMSAKPRVFVRFHAETNPNDPASTAMPAKLLYQRRDAMLSRVPVVSERDIKAIFPFKAQDGTYGCLFQFDGQGRNRIEVMSTEQRNTALVCFIATKNGQHQVADMLIDRPVTNGQITIPRGISEVEIHVLSGQFRVLGAESEREKKEREKREKEEQKKATDVTDGNFDPRRDNRKVTDPSAPPPPALPPADPRRKAPPSPNRRDLRALDQPKVGERVGD